MQRSDAIRAIKERINLVDVVRRYVDLKPNGSRFVAPCPFHQETKPSFSVNPDQGFFYCFGCQASGDLFEFYSRINGLDFKETLEQLAAEAGIFLEADRGADKNRKKELSEKSILLKLHELASAHFKNNLGLPLAEECRAYIAGRGLSRDICERFEVGWAQRSWHALEQHLQRSSHNLEMACQAGLLAKSKSGGHYDRFRGRLVFPIKNLSGQIIAFGGRIIADEDEAKYINSPDSLLYHKKEHLFGLAQARRGISAKGCAILTEGYMDVLTLHQFGYTNSVAVLGTALTDDQVRRIGGFTSKIILVFDGDAPGQKAALRSAAMFMAAGLACSAVALPDGEDIDSLLRKAGPESFDALRRNAPDGLQFCATVLRTFAPREAVKWVKEFLASLQMPELVSSYASRFAHELGLSETTLRNELKPFQSPRKFSPAAAQNVCDPENMLESQIISYAVRYPERLGDLRKIGARLLLASDDSRSFWELIEKWGPAEVFYRLDDKQKNFWVSKRMPPAPPLDNGERELDCLKAALDHHYANMHANSLAAALSLRKQGDNFETELEYLQALQEIMEKKQ